MPFEPRLFHRDDEDGLELPAPNALTEDLDDFPDDLGELADQLGADAQFLAQRFPAGECQPVGHAVLCNGSSDDAPQPGWSLGGIAQSKFWRHAFWPRAASVALVVVTLGVVVWQTGISGPPADSPAPASVSAGSAWRAATIEPHRSRPVVAPSAALTQVNAELIPVAVFAEMSGAEQEAMSDLLEGVPCRLEF